MKRRNFILSSLALTPLLAGAKLPTITFKESHPFLVKSGQSRNEGRYIMKGVTTNTIDVKVSSKDTDGQLTIIEQTGLSFKGGPPMHVHTEQDETFYIVEGEYVFIAGDERFALKAGDTIFLPRGVAHAFIQITERAKAVISYQPSGKMEEFFQATSKWTSPPTPEEVSAVFAANGMMVVGPPIKLD